MKINKKNNTDHCITAAWRYICHLQSLPFSVNAGLLKKCKILSIKNKIDQIIIEETKKFSDCDFNLLAQKDEYLKAINLKRVIAAVELIKDRREIFLEETRELVDEDLKAHIFGIVDDYHDVRCPKNTILKRESYETPIKRLSFFSDIIKRLVDLINPYIQTEYDKSIPISQRKYKEKTFALVAKILNDSFKQIPAIRFTPAQVKSRFYSKI